MMGVDEALGLAGLDQYSTDPVVGALAAEIVRIRGALDFFDSEIERREAQLAPATGMGASIRIGDFVSVPPSALSRLRWHLRNIRGAK